MEKVIYVKASELTGFAAGSYEPELAEFRNCRVHIAPFRGLVQVSYQGRSITLEHDDVMRLTPSGKIALIHGPSYYATQPLLRILAGSTISVRTIRFSDDPVELEHLDEVATMHNHGRWDRVTRRVKAGYGKLVVVFQPPANDQPIRYKKFVVREGGKGDQNVHQFFQALATRFPILPSGAFAMAQRETWEPWILEVGQNYYADRAQQPAQQAAA